MNDILSAIKERKSVRSYTDVPVTKEQIEMLLDAAMCAPTSKNNQPWQFYVVSNADKLQALSTALPFGKMINKATAAIVVCGDNTKGVSESDQALNWVMDCSAASQNILLSAEFIGLSSVWVGVFPYQDRIKKVQEVFDLPDHIIPLNVLPIGYPASAENKPKNKFKPDNIVWII